MKVRALEWNPDDKGYYTADDRRYLVTREAPGPFVLRAGRVKTEHRSLDEAKAEAQRDYESRTLAALIL